MSPGRTILVYYHIPEYVDRYRQLIVEKRPDMDILPCKNRDEIDEVIDRAEILFSGSSFPIEVLTDARRLQWIQSMSAGVENFMSGRDILKKVVLTKPKGIFGPIMAEYVSGYIFSLTQKMRRIYAQQAEHVWRPFVVESIREKTVGVMGLGSVGAVIASQISRLGAEVVGFDEQERHLPFLHREYGAAELDEFLQVCDFVVLTLPLTENTAGFLGARQFAEMKKSAVVINVSRGGLIRTGDLIDALEAGRIAGAVLDVFDEEPLPSDHALWRRDDVILTPHLSGPSLPEDLTAVFLDNLKRWESGRRLKGIVDWEKGY